MSKTEVIIEADLPINETVNITESRPPYQLPDYLFNDVSVQATQTSIVNELTSSIVTVTTTPKNVALTTKTSTTSPTSTQEVRWFRNYKGKLIKVRAVCHHIRS